MLSPDTTPGRKSQLAPSSAASYVVMWACSYWWPCMLLLVRLNWFNLVLECVRFRCGHVKNTTLWCCLLRIRSLFHTMTFPCRGVCIHSHWEAERRGDDNEEAATCRRGGPGHELPRGSLLVLSRQELDRPGLQRAGKGLNRLLGYRLSYVTRFLKVLEQREM